MEAFNNFSPTVRNLIDNCILGAIEFIEDMDIDLTNDEIETRTLRQYRTTVEFQTISMLACELDPETGETNLPECMYKAVRERINSGVTLSASLKR